MAGSEGGIPFRRQATRKTTHYAPTIGARPVCGTTAWHYWSSSNVEHVTCRRCKEES